LTRLFYILQEQGLLNNSLLTSAADVLIIPMTEDLTHSVSLAASMREQGLRVQIYGENKKLNAKLNYANKLGVPYVIFLGEDEISSGQITIKDMVAGSQVTASAGLLISGLCEKIKTLRSGAPISKG
jgi:histidyl-tRNA synthetase